MKINWKRVTFISGISFIALVCMFTVIFIIFYMVVVWIPGMEQQRIREIMEAEFLQP